MKDVAVSTLAFEKVHKKKPRGLCTWWFEGRSGNGVCFVTAHIDMMYSKAKRQAVNDAIKKKCTFLVLLP